MGKVSNVDGVLVLKMNLELGFVESAGRKIFPGPVMLGSSNTHPKKRFEKTQISSCEQTLSALPLG